MKEDILEQMVDEYLQHKGYFTRHNLKFRPAKDRDDYIAGADAVHSDIDVIGIHPLKRGVERVMVVSCKSWQQGFNPQSWRDAIAKNKVVGGRQAWRGFRELAREKWAHAFTEEVKRVSGSQKFTYVTAVTKLTPLAERSAWEKHDGFLRNLGGNPIKILTFEDMLTELFPTINQTVASSQLGRLLQLVKASGWSIASTPKRTALISPARPASEARGKR